MKSEEPIAEAVSLLFIAGRKELDGLKAKLGADILPLLSPGGLAGPIPVSTRAKAEVQKAALAKIIERIDRAILKSQRKLKSAKRVRLAGDIAAILGSSSVLYGTGQSASTAVTSLFSGGIAIVFSSAIALVGALSAALSEYVLRLPDGSTSLFEVYAGLGEAKYEAEFLTGEIDSFLHDDDSETNKEELAKAIGAANVLCRRMQKVFSFVLID